MVLTVAFIAMCLIIGYFLGTISTAYLVGKKNNIDIREHGSKNAGTTNAMRTMGKSAGIMVFLGDCIKTVVAILIMLGVGLLIKIDIDYQTVILATGFGAVLGHNFPFWMGFKGGKGIAVTGAVIIAYCFNLTDWICIAICIAVFALTVKITKYVSLGSLLVVTIFLVYVAITDRTESAYVRLMVFTFLFTALAFFMHRQNIVRLLNGTENKVGSKKSNINNTLNTNQPDNEKIYNTQGTNQQNNGSMYNNQINNQMNNGPMYNNQPNNQMVNNIFLEPSDLVNVDMSDFENVSNNESKNNTEQLYNADYFNGINKNMNINENINNNAYYKAYETCDTVEETREVEDKNYYGLNDSYSEKNSYYNE